MLIRKPLSPWDVNVRDLIVTVSLLTTVRESALE